MLPPEQQSPRTGLALSDLQSTSSSQTYTIGGGGISGLAIASHGSSNWSTRGVGGIGSGIGAGAGFGGLAGPSNGGGAFGNNGAGPSQGFGGFGSNSPANGGGIFNNCGCSSSDYGLFKK